MTTRFSPYDFDLLELNCEDYRQYPLEQRIEAKAIQKLYHLIFATSSLLWGCYMGTTQFSIAASILASSIGFLFAVLGFLISQWYQRRIERETITEALLIEVLDIVDRLLFLQERLDTLDPNEPKPEIGISRDDMQIFMSNTGKVGLLLHGASMAVVDFYSRIRQLIGGVPSRALYGRKPHQSSGSEIKLLQERISEAVLSGHVAVNTLSLQRPKRSILTGRLQQFEERSLERIKKRTVQT